MSSAFSLARNYNQFIPPIDLTFMVAAMQDKQQKFDKNWESTLGQIDAISKLDIAKDEDKEYLYSRTNELIKQINQYGTMDLSNNGLTRQISTHIKQAVDDNVINALEGTKKLRKYQEEVATIKEKHPDQYSVVNEAYGFSPINGWLNDGKVGSKFEGSASYTPFSNFKDVYDRLDKMATEYGDTSVEVPAEDYNITGKMIKTTYAGLKGNQVEYVVEQMLTPEQKVQLNINGWYNMGGSDEQARELFSEHAKAKAIEIDGEIVLAKNELGTLKKDSEAYLHKNNEIIGLEKKKKFYLPTPEELSKKTAASIGGYFEKEKLIDGTQMLHNHHVKSIEIKKDDVFWEQKKHDLDVLKETLGVSTTTETTKDINIIEETLADIDVTNSTVSSLLETAAAKQWGNNWPSVKRTIEARSDKNERNYEEVLEEELNKQHASLRGAPMAKIGELRLRQQQYASLSKKLNEVTPETPSTNNMGVLMGQLPGALGAAKGVLDLVTGKNTTTTDPLNAALGVLKMKTNPPQNLKAKAIEKDRVLLDEITQLHGKLGLKQKYLVTPGTTKTPNPDYDEVFRLAQAGSSSFKPDPNYDVTIEKTKNGYSISQVSDVAKDGTITEKSTIVSDEDFERIAPKLIIKAKNQDKGFVPISRPITAYYSDNDIHDVTALMGNDIDKVKMVMEKDAKNFLIQKGIEGGLKKEEVSPSINEIINRANELRVSVESTTGLANRVKVKVFNKQHMVAETSMDIPTYNGLLQEGIANPQIFLTTVLEDNLIQGVVPKL